MSSLSFDSSRVETAPGVPDLLRRNITYYSRLSPSKRRRTLVCSLPPDIGYAPGEGGPRRAGIPGLGLMGSPEYFFRADPQGVLKYLSADVMHNQVSIMTKLLVLMERLTPQQLNGTEPLSEADLFG